MTLRQSFKISPLRPLPVRNVMGTWVRFSTVTEIRVYDMQFTRKLNYYLIVYLYIHLFVYWIEDWTVHFNEPSKWPLDLLHILNRSTVESVTLQISASYYICDHVRRGACLKGPTVYFVKVQLKFQASDVAGRCTFQSGGHQRNHDKHLQKKRFWKLLSTFHKPMNGSIWHCWLHCE